MSRELVVSFPFRHETIKATLSHVELWGQRLFSKAITDEGDELTLVTTRGFTHLMLRHMDGKLQFRFTGMRYTPGLKAKQWVPSITTEFEDISAGRTTFEDVGPEVYTAAPRARYGESKHGYTVVCELGPAMESIMFETVPFDTEFDAYRYQKDPEYKGLHFSTRRDLIPRLVSETGLSLLGKRSIYHGVSNNGDHYFGVDLMQEMLNLDLPPKRAKSDPVLRIKSALGTYRGLIPVVNIGNMSFYNYNHIKDVLEDGGLTYITKNLYPCSRYKNYCFRHLYEYQMIVKKLLRPIRTLERKSSKDSRSQVDHSPIIHMILTDPLKIHAVIYKDCAIAEFRRDTPLLNPRELGEPVLAIPCEYNPDTHLFAYRDILGEYFHSEQEMLSYVGVQTLPAVANKLKYVLWKYKKSRNLLLGGTKKILLETSNIHCPYWNKSFDQLTLYARLSYMDGETPYYEAYANLYDFLGVFGRHVPLFLQALRQNMFAYSLTHSWLKDYRDREGGSVASTCYRVAPKADDPLEPMIEGLLTDAMITVPMIFALLDLLAKHPLPLRTSHPGGGEQRSLKADRIVKGLGKLWHNNANHLRILLTPMPEGVEKPPLKTRSELEFE